MHTIFDIACNFTNERFDKDLNDVISRSFDNNITKFGLICSQLKDVQRIIEIKDNRQLCKTLEISLPKVFKEHNYKDKDIEVYVYK